MRAGPLTRREYTNLQDINGKDYKVGEYVISNGDIKQFVIYWYQAHGRSIPNEYMAKGYMVADAIRMNRTDGALVRVITQVMPSESVRKRRDPRRPLYPADDSESATIHSKLTSESGGSTQVVSVPRSA